MHRARDGRVLHVIERIRRTYRRARRWYRRQRGLELRVQPDVELPHDWHGTSYGGWLVPTAGIGAQDIVYSIGVGRDLSFDVSLIDKYGVRVWAFDPTPASIAWVADQVLPPALEFRPVGVAAYDGTATFYPPADASHVSHSIVHPAGRAGISVEVRRLATLMAEHAHQRIDLLKLDIEGAEYDVLWDMLASGIRPRVLLVEFHFRFFPDGLAQTKNILQALRHTGYRISAVSDGGEEFVLIHD